MNIKVFVERTNQQREMTVDTTATMKVLLEEMKINPVEVVLARNGEVVTEDAAIEDGDTISIFSVISGG